VNAIRLGSIVIVLLLSKLPGQAQDSPTAGLRKDGANYLHDASKSRFTLPKDWEAQKPEGFNDRLAKLNIRLPEKSAEVTITWSPLKGRMDEALDLEMIELTQKYGKDKVAKKDPITVANKPVFVISLDEGTARDVSNQQGKEAGIIYLFEAGPDENNRWKLKVRGTYPKKDGAQGQQLVEQLLQNFQW
jgi:hypothetical protein